MPKILADLRDDGEVISRKTVAKIMRQLSLTGISPKRWKTTTLIDHAGDYPVGAVKRQWDSGGRALARRPGAGRHADGYHPARTAAGQVAFRTDRGTQYASAQITAFAAANGITLGGSEVFGEDVADHAVAGTTGIPPRR